MIGLLEKRITSICDSLLDDVARQDKATSLLTSRRTCRRT